MVSTVMGAAMISTMYFLRANCAQHGGSASGGGLISASLLSYWALSTSSVRNRVPIQKGSRTNVLVASNSHSSVSICEFFIFDRESKER